MKGLIDLNSLGLKISALHQRFPELHSAILRTIVSDFPGAASAGDVNFHLTGHDLPALAGIEVYDFQGFLNM
jgi:hypothetical protein